MTTPRNCIELEMLIKSYYMAELLDSQQVSEAHREALHRLLKHGMVDLNGGYINATERGKFYVQHLLTVPFPETSYRIPSQ